MVSSKFLSTHPSWNTTYASRSSYTHFQVSIHAPLAECDYKGKMFSVQLSVSIHAPLVECDYKVNMNVEASAGFYPRTPRGVRQRAEERWLRSQRFLSTHPSWSATHLVFCIGHYLIVSIHAPLVECDCVVGTVYVIRWGFYPRTPRGVRQ